MKMQTLSQDILLVKELESGVPNIFCMKSQIEGYRIHQLVSADNSTRNRSNVTGLTVLPRWQILDMLFNLLLHAKQIQNIPRLLFHPAEVLLKGFTTLFKIILTQCGIIMRWKFRISRMIFHIQRISCGLVVMTLAYQMERQWFESGARRMLLSQKGFEYVLMKPPLPAKDVGPQPANVRNEG